MSAAPQQTGAQNHGSVLIVGGDSMLGVALSRGLRDSGFNVGTTSRRGNSAAIHLDLEGHDIPGSLLDLRFEYVVFCAGVTGVEACRLDSPGSRRINVHGTIRAAEHFARQGSFILHLSTNLVFDGQNPRPTESAFPSPLTEYGRQKLEAEQAILSQPAAAVVRLTKVFHAGLPLLSRWCDDLRDGRSIRALDDLIVAPLSTTGVVNGIVSILTARARGIWHFSGPNDHSYFEAAQALARAIGAAPGLVTRGHAADLRDVTTRLAAFSALDTTHTRNRLKIDFSDLEGVMQTVAVERRIHLEPALQ
jgi:dTDP-4-dehydrorhamnose reductase